MSEKKYHAYMTILCPIIVYEQTPFYMRRYRQTFRPIIKIYTRV